MRDFAKMNDPELNPQFRRGWDDDSPLALPRLRGERGDPPAPSSDISESRRVLASWLDQIDWQDDAGLTVHVRKLSNIRKRSGFSWRELLGGQA
ncbi:hypothetical protein HBA54_03285 [Pelagibius litoralis]|uniref:Uncharacterized protein n=1 Tax=Pelagibius litoralis TaxID=374515 RepID=A0A967C1P8_9PROT|nr:hypothetical protein [Pelagibius litoralis]NIA67606.1 hypothetical protein [Pelagibius litoralis]